MTYIKNLDKKSRDKLSEPNFLTGLTFYEYIDKYNKTLEDLGYDFLKQEPNEYNVHEWDMTSDPVQEAKSDSTNIF